MKSSNKILTVILIAAIAAILVYFLSEKGGSNGTESPGPSKLRKVDEGKLKNGEYRNEYYGMTFRIPRGWHTIDRETLTKLEDLNSDALFGHNPEFKKEAELGRKQMTTLLAVSKHRMMTAINNPTILVRSMDISAFADEISGPREFLEKITDEVEKYTKGLQMVGGIRNLKIDGKRFHYRDSIITMGQVKIYNRLLIHISGSNALSVVLTAMDVGSIGELTAVFNTTSFDD